MTKIIGSHSEDKFGVGSIEVINQRDTTAIRHTQEGWEVEMITGEVYKFYDIVMVSAPVFDEIFYPMPE